MLITFTENNNMEESCIIFNRVLEAFVHLQGDLSKRGWNWESCFVTLFSQMLLPLWGPQQGQNECPQQVGYRICKNIIRWCQRVAEQLILRMLSIEKRIWIADGDVDGSCPYVNHKIYIPTTLKCSTLHCSIPSGIHHYNPHILFGV